MQTQIIQAFRLIRHNYRSHSHTFRHIRHYYRPKYQAIRSNQMKIGNNGFIIWGHNGILRTVIHHSFSNYSLLLTLQKAVVKAQMKKLFTDQLFFEFIHLTMTLVNYQSTTTGKWTSDSMSDETIAQWHDDGVQYNTFMLRQWFDSISSYPPCRWIWCRMWSVYPSSCPKNSSPFS